jgi:DNA modification methylase
LTYWLNSGRIWAFWRIPDPEIEVKQQHLFGEPLPDAPSHGHNIEIDDPGDLADPRGVLSDLTNLDWAFERDDTSYLTHDIHPYPAKFIPQIPATLIARLSLRGELVFDPFGGSGTTALEAVRLGRRALSADLNPIGTLVAQVKSTPLMERDVAEIDALRTSILSRQPFLPTDPDHLCGEFREFIPRIPNIEKWFPTESIGELAMIRARVSACESAPALRVALLALSRTILSASFQDSETRYASRPRPIKVGEPTRRFLGELEKTLRSVVATNGEVLYGVTRFVTADSRHLDTAEFPADSVDLIVTSPPYGNAYDYHLYHRFRLYWLGHLPAELAQHEIGSHLRHQREKSGYREYLDDLRLSIEQFFRILRAGRYAAIVVGDPVYDGKMYDAGEDVGVLAESIGFERIGSIQRKIHSTKRSVVGPGRRASSESIVILRRPPKQASVRLHPLPYKPWQYESMLRIREIESIAGVESSGNQGELHLDVDPYTLPLVRRLAFTHSYQAGNGPLERSWQAILENGWDDAGSARKDPKYTTHGVHPFKGKFYPQLAKALINCSAISPGARILDPFCGSGTALLEGYLNGFRAFGSDLNPLSAKITSSKLGVLDLNPTLVSMAVRSIQSRINNAPQPFPKDTDQFPETVLSELFRWFPEPVIFKLNWLLRSIRSTSNGVLRDYFEVIVSSIVRQISQQDPADLRVRRRKHPIGDADVLEHFQSALRVQFARLERFWKIRGFAPSRFYRARVVEGDSRSEDTFTKLDLAAGDVDLVLTSPPYATALPYIDTDRLSLLVLSGLASSDRRPLEYGLAGSREINEVDRRALEEKIEIGQTSLPAEVIQFVGSLLDQVSSTEVGFRRRNLPALILRFFTDIDEVLRHCHRLLRPGGTAMIVIGDNTTRLGGVEVRIPTTDLLLRTAQMVGFALNDDMPITVTTENMVHIRHSIKQNRVLWLQK